MTDLSHLEPVRVFPTEDRTLELFSNSKNEDIDTCPTYAIVRHHHRRAYPTSSRSLALEYGGAAHEAFAAMRLWQLRTVQSRPDLSDFRAAQVFPQALRWSDAVKEASKHSDVIDQLNSIAFSIIHSGPYYDDPNDQIRTVSELENVILKAAEEHVLTQERWPIFIFESKNNDPWVGVEQSFDVTIEYADGFQIRFGGTLDAILLWLKNNRVYVGENKVMSRPDDHWQRAFLTSHQVTGYIIGLNTVLSSLGADMQESDGVKVFGFKNKQTGHQDDYRTFIVGREPHMLMPWFYSLRETVDEFNKYRHDLERAPRRTKACNRYFKACSLVDFCADTPAGRAQQLEEMGDRGLSPTEEALGVEPL